MAARQADERLIGLFTDLVRIDAVSGRERPVADYVRGVLEGLGLEVEEDGAGGGRYGDGSGDGSDAACGNLLCRAAGGGDVALLAHMDTVLTTAGLEPRVADGRVTARGAPILGADNRAGVAALLWAAERLCADGSPPPFTAAFTIREETDLAGARSVALPGAVEMAVAFDSSLRPGHYIHRASGARSFRAEITGRSAHAAISPERGVDAVRTAARALVEIPAGRLDDGTSLNVGTVRGGSAINVVPDRCVLEGEVRSFSRAEVERWTEHAREILARACEASGAGLDFSTSWDFEPYEVPRNAPVCRRVASALARLDLAPRPASSPGGSDANALNARGLPTVNVGIGAQNPHSADEHILLEDLAAAGALAVELVRGG